MATKNNVMRLTDNEKALIEHIRDLDNDTYMDIRLAIEVEARVADSQAAISENEKDKVEIFSRAKKLRDFGDLISDVHTDL